MDLMATDASAQRAPRGGGTLHRKLLFYTRFQTNSTAGVDVFNDNVGNILGSLRTCFGYCFP